MKSDEQIRVMSDQWHRDRQLHSADGANNNHCSTCCTRMPCDTYLMLEDIDTLASIVLKERNSKVKTSKTSSFEQLSFVW